MAKMKDSGIQWIGLIPQEWKMLRLQYILSERNEKNDPIKTKEILSLTAAQGVIPYAEKEGGGNKPKEDLTAYKLAYPNDVVMNSMNVLSGSVDISNYFGCVSPVYYMFYSDRDDINIRYYNYIFKTKVFQRSLMGLGNGILIKETESGSLNTIRMRIPSEKLKKLLFCVPTIEEQNKIVDLLDDKIAEIDAVIDKTKATIEDYKKYKQSVITEVVTKGLKPDISMKDSGAEWIDKIPENWKIQKLKNIFSFGKGLPITKDDLEENGIAVISYGQIHSKKNTTISVDKSLIRYVNERYLQSNKSSLVNIDDFIFADTSEDLLGCGNCVRKDVDEFLFAGYHSIILHASKPKYSKYLAYLFQTDCWRSQIRCRVSGIKLFSITQSILRENTIILPDEKDIEALTVYLDNKCKEIDKLITQKENLIEELEAYKKSIIYEYVTGKKEVI